MGEWLSDNRALIAAFLVIGLVITFFISLFIGRREAVRRAKDEVFGDPERTKGGWYWALCGVCSILLIWFYFSWGVGRAYFPQAANEMCQVAKLEEVVSPIKAALPIGSRYYKSTLLVGRNTNQLTDLEIGMPVDAFSPAEQAELNDLISQLRLLMRNASDPAKVSSKTRGDLDALVTKLNSLSEQLRGGYEGLTPTAEGLAQPKWGVSLTEIPPIPTTARGVLFDNVANGAGEVTTLFNKIRNHPQENARIIADVKTRIDALKQANDTGSFDEVTSEARKKYIKAVDRIYKRLDDGTIFPASSLAGINSAMVGLDEARDDARGSLAVVEGIFFPGQGIVKSRTQCTEQGSARWLPKPTDVVATFVQLSNPDIEAGGGFKGIPLFWWKWLPVADVVGFFVPDWIADIWPGEYAQLDADGTINSTFKDDLLAFATGDVNLGHIPMFSGHLWDSVFRVLVALGLGILLGVPLGLFMGVSRFFKSFFDPLIELYRPVPPLAWAPLILTIFGITDDGKIFLLFMVAFAIMVISARTGASGTQLSKIRASHSLGASTGQIMRNVILPNALPEILTGVRIAIGVCWGTLVAAEILAGTTGVGFIENIARTVSDYEMIWVTILIMGVLGLVFDLIMRWVIHKTIPWRGKG